MTDEPAEGESPHEIGVDDHPRPEIAVADIAAVASLGRDLEVGLFALTPRVVSMSTGGPKNSVGPREVNMQPLYRETARVRLGPIAASHLALNLIMALRESHEDEFEALQKTLAKALAHFETLQDHDGEVH